MKGGERMKLDRVSLTDIRESASMQIPLTVEPAWKEAFAELARAADRLDAMMARCFAEEEVPTWLNELK